MNPKSILRKFALAAAVLAAGAGMTIPAQAGNDALLDALVGNGTISQQQADEIRKQTRVKVTPNRATVSELKIRGRIQGQWAHASGQNREYTMSAGDYNTFELRRMRIGVQGRIYEDWRFMAEINALSTVDLDAATLTYAAIPEANITFGKAKPQFGHEENTSSASILTVERSLLSNRFNGGKPLGLRVHGGSGVFNYYVGVYNGQSTSTGRMGSNMDSYLWNASGELVLDALTGSRSRVRLDYLRDGSPTGYYAFRDAFAVSGHFAVNPLDIRAEYMQGREFGSLGGRKTRGFYLMPSAYIIPKVLEGVVRFEHIKGDAGVNLGHQSRYADRVPGIFRNGNEYHSLYLGANYYIHGDNLKFMFGTDFARLKDELTAARSRATTFFSAARMQF